jgi:endonuclease YncB( thermonuclease family)
VVYEYFAVCDRVIDGDTVAITLDLGFYVKLGSRPMRLFGINTPESTSKDPTVQKRALAAVAFIEERLLPIDREDLPAPRPQIKVQSKKPDASDKYGRLLGTILYLPFVEPPAKKKGRKVLPIDPPDWHNLNDELIAAGLALPYDGTGPKPT